MAGPAEPFAPYRPKAMSAPTPVVKRSGPIEIVLPIEGMTCASCVNRIERYLKKTDGVVDANVNLATERATVTVDPRLTGRPELVAAVEAAGYDVRAESAQSSALEADPDEPARRRERRQLLAQAAASRGPSHPRGFRRAARRR